MYTKKIISNFSSFGTGICITYILIMINHSSHTFASFGGCKASTDRTL